MDVHDPLTAPLSLERRIERRFQSFHRQEARRQAGVAWSGMSSPPPPPRSETQLRRAAEDRLRFEKAWRASAQGEVLTAVASIQRACEAAHAAAERARSAAARGLGEDPAPCRNALGEVGAQAADLLRALRRARRALKIPSSPTGHG